MPAPKLGIVAGSGTLPARLVERCRAEGRAFLVAAIEGEADPALVAGVEHLWVNMGAASAALRQLRAAGVDELVLAGGVRRPALADLRPAHLATDWRVVRFFARLGMRAFGDNTILSAVIQELEAEGFKLIGADDILGDALAPEGPFGRHRPDAQALADIGQGMAALKLLGALDIGQGIVVQQGLVLGVEAIEGTDALIRRSAALKREGPRPVLVKAKKPHQERRADLPTIGPETVRLAETLGLAGIAVEAGATLVLDRELLVRLADERGIFVVGTIHEQLEGAAPAIPERLPEYGSETETGPLFFLIAGEASGDAIGAELMRALRQRTEGRCRFAGIGGERMAAEGLASLIPIRELAIMGMLEVLPRARRLLRRVAETVVEIERCRPVAVITIDSSGFCHRVTERLKPRARRPLLVHYVAPMIWAWRAYRAKVTARACDHLLTLFPFEPPLFRSVGLAATYVGHPVIESGADRGFGAGFRRDYGIRPEATLLAVLPGSRSSEVRRLLPIFRAAVALLAAHLAGRDEAGKRELTVVVPTVAVVADEVEAGLGDWPVRTILLRDPARKFDAFAAADAALAASGTVSLELGMAGVPTVVGYRILPLTAWAVSRVVKIPYASIANLVLGREAVPEFLQGRCRPENLAGALRRLIDDPAARTAQIEAVGCALDRIGRGGDRPSLRAADRILELLRQKNECASNPPAASITMPMSAAR